MINNHSKGLRTQRKAREYLEEQGYTVHVIQHTRFSKDIFGLFDGLGIPQIPFKQPVLFQVKTKIDYLQN